MERFTILPTGDVYMRDPQPEDRIEDYDMSLADRAAIMISQYDPDWDSAQAIAERIVAMVINEKEPK
jgi:hypothetical protein